MEITVLYDNEAMPGFKDGWGFSCTFEHGGKRVLFDTGWDGNDLMFNMEKLGLKKEDFDVIVLSHSHWDHTGGLAQVLHPAAQVHVPASFSKRMKKEISKRAIVHEVDGPTQIMDGLYLTGELGSGTKEQALAVETGKGIFVITGCAHPGLDTMLYAAGRFGKVIGAMGGFHDFDRLEALQDLEILVPCHCTEHKGRIVERYPEKIETCAVGRRIRPDP